MAVLGPMLGMGRDAGRYAALNGHLAEGGGTVGTIGQ